MLALDEFFDGPTVDGAENYSLKSEGTGSGNFKEMFAFLWDFVIVI